MNTRVEKLTPKKAGEWLSSMAANRPARQPHVRNLAGAIKAGRYLLNGEAIKFDDKNQMIDGQHRCLAVILADMPVDVLVVRNLPSDNGIFETLDSGRSRNIGDMFARAGEENYAMLASAVAWLWRHQNGTMAGREKAPRHDEANDVLKAHPKLRDSCHAVHCVKKVMRTSMAACLHYLFAGKSPADADRFFQQLGTGENISSRDATTSAIYWLRNRMIEDRSSTAKLPPGFFCALTIKAWNAMRAKKLVKNLKWSSDEEFPTIL
jgi:hypothetical protein